MNIALLMAGGVGSRMKADRPKQFIEVMGKPVIAYTIEKFENHPEIDQIAVVCVATHIAELQAIVETYGFKKVTCIVPGGDTYQESSLCGLEALRSLCAPDDIVVMHNAASPIVGADLISDSIRVAKEHDNAISLQDTILCMGRKTPGAEYTDESIDRDTLATLNTPESMKFSYYDGLYRRAEESGVLQTCEPHITSLVYAMGDRMYFSKGSTLNIKLTTQDDLMFFKAYLIAQSMED